MLDSRNSVDAQWVMLFLLTPTKSLPWLLPPRTYQVCLRQHLQSQQKSRNLYTSQKLTRGLNWQVDRIAQFLSNLKVLFGAKAARGSLKFRGMKSLLGGAGNGRS